MAGSAPKVNRSLCPRTIGDYQFDLVRGGLANFIDERGPSLRSCMRKNFYGGREATACADVQNWKRQSLHFGWQGDATQRFKIRGGLGTGQQTGCHVEETLARHNRDVDHLRGGDGDFGGLKMPEFHELALQRLKILGLVRGAPLPAGLRDG